MLLLTVCFSVPWLDSLTGAEASSLLRFQVHTQTHYSRYDCSGRRIGPSQRPLPDITQHLQETHIHSMVGFEPTIPASERPHTHALDRAANGTGRFSVKHIYMS
jgi:hypothetical protein